jgi:ubiquinone/menaquinone biosynthesis C-methylase UbiE
MGFYENHVVPHLVNLAMRSGQLAPYRRRIISLAKGRVLEIGVGSGLNLPLYTNSATEVLGVEPHPRLLDMASKKVEHIPTKLIEASAESIPLEDHSIDTVLTSWTLCTIPNVSAALTDMRRILKPTGQLLLVEHGLAPDEKVRGWQHRLTPVWKRIAGGCHLDRPIAEIVRSAGFRIDHLETGYMRGPKPMTFMYEGIATPT